MPPVKALDVSMLYQRCDSAQLPFETTDDLAAATEIVGQERAVDAIRLGLDIRRPGYNLFVLGDTGSGRHSAVKRLLEIKAAQEPLPCDWCYTYNFATPNKPSLLKVPAGRGDKLKRDVAELLKAIPAAFDSDEYRSRLEAITGVFKTREETALQELGQAASEEGIVLVRTPHGFIFTPLAGEETMASEDFEKLPDAERERLSDLIKTYGERLKQLMLKFPRWRREMQTQVKDASRETLSLAVGHLIEELKEEYQDLPEVLKFLDDAMQDIIEEGEPLREQGKGENEEDPANVVVSGNISTLRYRVNLLVDNAETKTAPVVFEDNPIYPNLVGRVDHISQMGTLLTNFTLIKAGALQRANGGYLVLDALKVLLQPFAWEGLKRALRSNQVRIESLGQVYGLVSTVTLDPEPMPLSIKVVLIGERRIYYLLKALDPDFSELFKIAADFESELVRDAGNTLLYADYIASLVRKAELRPFERDAVARIIEHTSRLCGDAERLCTSRWKVADLLQEADHCANTDGRPTVQRADIETALAAGIRRADRIRGKYQEAILRDTLLISVSGERIGQINGLAVISLDDFRFAHPVRLTATARVGSGDVIDIERETELGGPIHSKGVLILAAFLGARYARNVPLSLTASLVFEQSYGPIEGDSASMAELCALLSVLAKAPIRQSLAITGSVNQFGDAQAIGGVNEKIEGFFDICQARGLTGDQGVLIPAANVKHLMLRQDVIDACAEGRFSVYPYNNVDEVIERLTGVPADTLNAQITVQLAELSELRKAFANGKEGKNGGKKRG